MPDNSVVDELRVLLRPFVKEHPLKKDTVLQEDVEALIHGAVAFEVADKLLVHVKENPNAVFWDFLKMMDDDIPEDQLVPHGQEDILDDDDISKAGI